MTAFYILKELSDSLYVTHNTRTCATGFKQAVIRILSVMDPIQTRQEPATTISMFTNLTNTCTCIYSVFRYLDQKNASYQFNANSSNTFESVFRAEALRSYVTVRGTMSIKFAVRPESTQCVTKRSERRRCYVHHLRGPCPDRPWAPTPHTH